MLLFAECCIRSWRQQPFCVRYFLQSFASFHFVTVLFVLQENIWITHWIWPHRWHQVGKLPIPWHQLQWSRKRDKGSSASIPRSCRLFGSFSFYYWIHLRNWHGGDGQHHDLFAGLVSVEGGPRIPLISESIFEVALCVKRMHSSTLIFSQHSGQEPLNVVVTDNGGRYDSWNLLQVNSFFNSILILSSRWKIRWPHRPRWFTLSSCL